MAKVRAHLSKGTKRRLIAEAGGKCANPGCFSRRTEFHHIREWHIYGTHDEAHMIALCPTCHTHAHHGELRVTDEDLYRWKALKRRPSRVDQVSIEPAQEQKLLLGSICVSGPQGVRVIGLSDTNFLAFTRRDEDLMFLNIGIADREQKPLLSVTENVVRYKDDRISFETVPGHVRIMAELASNILPYWLPGVMKEKHPSCLVDGQILVADLKVQAPGVVKVDGVWCNNDTAMVISDGALSFYPPENGLTLVGAGLESVLHYTGPIDQSLFALRQA